MILSIMTVIDAPLSNLRSHEVQQCQPGAQLHQDGRGHGHALQDGLEG
jgi:hypothetical protein